MNANELMAKRVPSGSNAIPAFLASALNIKTTEVTTNSVQIATTPISVASIAQNPAT
ncbi:MAG TPA: hypothetical protein VGM97_11315 [Steroidobacteraceae bacterium]